MTTVSAQIITIIDQATLQPVENVLLYNEDRTKNFSTNHRGKTAEVTFSPDEIITINHPFYNELITSLSMLKGSEFQVRLQEKIIHIEEVVVSAQRWEQDKKQIPNQIVSIGARMIEFSNPQTTADMLGQTGQVFIQKSQLGGGSPMIRGFAANSVLIVVDGIRMNNAIFRGGNLQNIISIDPLTLENTEVLFGPGSVMYGSDALGGVMHFRTFSPGFISEGKPQIKVNSLVRYASANNERTGHVDVSIRGHKISNFTSFTFSDYEHLKTGSRRTNKFPAYGKRSYFVVRANHEDQMVANPDVNKQVYSGYHQINLLHKTRWRFGDHADMTYTFNYSTTSDIPRYDRLIETNENGIPESAEWFYGPQKWITNSLQTNVYTNHKLFDEARLILAWQQVEESRNDRDFKNDWLSKREEQVDVLTANLDLEKKLSPEHELFYGTEWFYNDVVSTAFRRNIVTGEVGSITPRYPDAGSDYSGLAGYLSYKWQPSHKITFNSGLRYSQTWLNARLKDTGALGFPFEKYSISNGAFNGNAGFAWLPNHTWQVNGLFSTGFRAPNIDDVGKIFDGSNGIVTVPNPMLRPEYIYNTEVGLSKSIKNKLKLSVNAYYSHLENAIIQDDFTFNGTDSILFDGEISRVQALVNASSANIYGGSVQVNYAINNSFILSSSYTLSKGEDSDGRPLRHTTPDFGNVALTYRYKKLRCQANMRFSGKRAFEDLPQSEQQKTHLYTEDGALAWQTFNIEGSYHFSKNITINTALENLFDKHYRPYSSGISAPGRNFVVALKAGF